MGNNRGFHWAACILALGFTNPTRGDDRVNYLYPAKDVNPDCLKSESGVTVSISEHCVQFTLTKEAKQGAVVFYPGGGVDPVAYAPMAKSLAARGYSVYLMKLSGKPGNPDTHRQQSIQKGKAVIAANPKHAWWVVMGHSLGASVAARHVFEEPKQFRGLILIGTTHPRDFDISSYAGDVTKIVASNDEVARASQSEANKKKLPAATHWIRIEGGNHAQFGYYGSQPGDGIATISREKQQSDTRNAILEALARTEAEGE